MKQNSIDQEVVIHGTQWNRVHGGYFSDPGVAGLFLGEVRKVMAHSPPDVVVDFGGGTGFLLEELLKQCPYPHVQCLDVDLSEKQLACVTHPRISTVFGSVEDFDRRRWDCRGRRFLFLMRSVLHYFARDRWLPVLRHIRAQMMPGEYFVHQTACFESERECDCLNALYREMGTGKEYPMVTTLHDLLKEAGWSVRSTLAAPRLPLESGELEMRYHLAPAESRRIRSCLLNRFGPLEDAFVSTAAGFRAFLPYTIFTCTA